MKDETNIQMLTQVEFDIVSRIVCSSGILRDDVLESSKLLATMISVDCKEPDDVRKVKAYRVVALFLGMVDEIRDFCSRMAREINPDLPTPPDCPARKEFEEYMAEGPKTIADMETDFERIVKAGEHTVIDLGHIAPGELGNKIGAIVEKIMREGKA